MNTFGIVGAGNIAHYHYKAIKHFKDNKVIGIYDTDILKSRLFTIKNKTKIFDSLNDLCKKCDYLIICSDNYSHFSNLKVAIKNNCIILCEKPLLLDSSQYFLIGNYLNNYNSSLFIAFNYRFLPIIQEIKKLVEKNNLIFLEINFHKNSSLSKKKKNWKDFKYSKGTGGVIGDLGVHLIDLLFFLIPKTKFSNEYKINKFYKSRRKSSLSEIEESFFTNFFFKKPNISSKITASKISKNNYFNIKAIFKEFTVYYDSINSNYFEIKYKEKIIKKTTIRRRLVDPKNEVYGWHDSFFKQIKLLSKGHKYRKNDLCNYFEYQFHQNILDDLINRKKTYIT